MFSDEMIGYICSDNSTLGYGLEIELPDGMFRMHTGVGSILINGDIYYGFGDLGEIGTINGAGDDKPVSLTCSVTGVPSDILIDSLTANIRSSAVTLFAVVFDGDDKVIATEASFVGFISDYVISAGDTNSIEITVSDEFELYEMPWYKYWTDENHQADYPGDEICKYASQLSERTIYWGAKKDASTLG